MELQIRLLGLAAFAAGAAARDVEARMHPLVYTAPVGKAAYLGGSGFRSSITRRTPLT